MAHVHPEQSLRFHGTTILALRGADRVVMAGDGQVTLNNTVVKHTARKVRRIYNDTIMVGLPVPPQMR